MRSDFVSVREAAFIANVDDRAVNRAIDERILPEQLVDISDGRRIAELGVGFFSFYHEAESELSAPFRRRVIQRVFENVLKRFRSVAISFEDEAFLAPGEVFRIVEKDLLALDLRPVLKKAASQARKVRTALNAITSEEDVLGGQPVFRGTRVPIDVVLASVDANVPLERVQRAYPSVTPEMIESARIYAAVRPRRGRPPSFAERMGGRLRQRGSWSSLEKECDVPPPD